MTLQPQPVDRTLWFEAALTPDGWARDVRLTIAGGRIAGLETGAARGAGDEGGGVALPGVANVHSHAFQRAMAGLTEARGPSEDDFWTWRELMYRFLDRGGPEEIEAITAAARQLQQPFGSDPAYARLSTNLEAARTRVACASSKSA